MSETNTPSGDKQRVCLKGGILSYPALLKPKKLESSQGDPKYQANIIFSKTEHAEEIKKAKTAILAAAVAKWGDKAQQVLQYLGANKRLCLKSGDTVLDSEGYDASVMFISASNGDQPQLVDGQRQKVDAARINAVFYPGAIVNVVLRFWALDHKDATIGKRMCCSLEIVQFAGQGKRIGHAPPKAEDYLDVLDAEPLDEASAPAGEDEFSFM